MSGNRRIRGENRFYNSPPMRKLQQERENEAKLKKMKEKGKEKQERQRNYRSRTAFAVKECSTSNCSVSSRVAIDGLSNLGRFLECTTPVVPAHCLPMTSIKGWRIRKPEYHPYFLLSDLWHSFEEWSAFGVGVPLLLNGSDSVVQYYVPYLSGIQLYANPSRAHTISNGSAETSQNLNRISSQEKSSIDSSSNELEFTCNSPGHLIFEHLEEGSPFSREPLLEKVLNLSLQFPPLKTYRSCDLSSSSWLSVAWYPIYRIPVSHTLQNLEACFLTFHSLSAPFQGKKTEVEWQKNPNQAQFSIPTFGLASYKFKLSVWIPESGGFGSDIVEYEHQRLQTLLQAAQKWLGRLQVILPDFTYFLSRNNFRLS